MKASDRFPEAHLMQRRIRARQLYRVRRDHKIAVDFLGREFTVEIYDQLHGKERLPVRLERYNPDNNTVNVRALWIVDALQMVPTYITWTTDQFWSMLRTGQLERA